MLLRIKQRCRQDFPLSGVEGVMVLLGWRGEGSAKRLSFSMWAWQVGNLGRTLTLFVAISSIKISLAAVCNSLNRVRTIKKAMVPRGLKHHHLQRGGKVGLSSSSPTCTMGRAGRHCLLSSPPGVSTCPLCPLQSKPYHTSQRQSEVGRELWLTSTGTRGSDTTAA